MQEKKTCYLALDFDPFEQQRLASNMLWHLVNTT